MRRRAALVAAGVLAFCLTSPTAFAVDWSQAQTVDAAATEYEFKPNSFTFKQGAVYHLHLVNPGKELHEFASPEFFKAIEIRNPEVLNPDRTEIAVQPGKSADLFFVAQTPGAYKLRCPDHDWAGMTGVITITP